MTPTEVRSNRWAQARRLDGCRAFLAGFFTPIGLWTGPILGVWFVLTQKPLRGFAWVFLFAAGSDAGSEACDALLTSGVHAAPRLFGLILLGSLLAVVPLVFHRLVSPRLLRPSFNPAVSLRRCCDPWADAADVSLAGSASASLLRTFLACWLASALVWMWNQEFRFSRFRGSAAAFPTLYLPLAGLAVYRGLTHFKLFATNLEAQAAWAALAGSVALAAVAAMRRPKIVSWVGKAEGTRATAKSVHRRGAGCGPRIRPRISGQRGRRAFLRARWNSYVHSGAGSCRRQREVQPPLRDDRRVLRRYAALLCGFPRARYRFVLSELHEPAGRESRAIRCSRLLSAPA